MAIKYGFFNSMGGDRKYNTEDIGKYLMGIVSSGVYADKSTSLQVLANDGMEVEVQPGRAMLHYHYLESDTPLTFTLDAGGVQDRVDAIVARLDMNNRLCEIVVKKGTEAAKPTAPAMERTDTVKEYMLASVYITKLSSSITQTNITDTRADKTVCGFVTGVIDQVDTTTLFVQWKAAYDAAVAEMLAWYEGLPGNFVDGNGLPIPNPGDAGKALHVNENGTGYELVDGVTTDETLTIQGAAADAAAVGRALTVPNLLDNSNLANPVNLNGKTSYTGIGYGIEKWFSSSGYGAITVNDGYVNIKSTNGTSAAYLLQFVEPGKIKSGKKYTAVCKLADGSHHIVTAAVSTAMTEAVKYIYVGGVQLGTIRVKYDAGQAQYAVLFSTVSTEGINVEHVALYEGEYTAENLPVYRPRGYSVEEAICGAGLSMELLWENASPNSDFAAQTISLDLSQYSMILVFAIPYISWGDQRTSFMLRIHRGNDMLVMHHTKTDNSETWQRHLKKVENGIYVDAGYGNGKALAGALVPTAIYGIKGVSA